MRGLAAIVVSFLVFPAYAAWQPAPRPVGEGRIAGRVLTESGAAVGGAVVWAILFTGEPGATARYSASAEPDGGYVIDRLPAGRYNVFAEKPGYTNMLVQPGRMSGGRTVDLDSALAASGIDLVLRRTGSVAGRVTRPDGTPVEKARVVSQIQLPNGRMLGTGPGAQTDADGQYRLDGIPPGKYAITAIYSVMHEMIGKAVPDEYQEWARTFHPATAEFERAAQITIEGGDELEHIDITLQPQPRYRISGVLAADGVSLRSMRVEYASSGGTSGVLTHILDDGQFTIGGVSGPVTLLGNAESDKGPLIGLTEVNVTGSLDGVRLTLGAPAHVRGRLVFEGAPAPDAELRVQLATDWFRARGDTTDDPDAARVDGNGQFSIGTVIGNRRITVLGLPPAWQIKEVRRGGRVLADRRLALTAGEVVDDLEIVITKVP